MKFIYQRLIRGTTKPPKSLYFRVNVIPSSRDANIPSTLYSWKRCFFEHGKLKRCYETNEMALHDKYGKYPNYSINSWLRECFYNLRPFVPKSSVLNTTKVSKTIYILGNYSWIIIFAVPAGIFFFSITENDNFYSNKSDIISI